MDPAPQAPQKNTEKDERIPIKSLRTYQGDVEEAMAKNNYSATTILVAEQKKRESAPPPPKIQRAVNPEGRNILFTVLGILLFVLGIGTVIGVYYVRSHEEVVIEKQTKALIEFTKEEKVFTASSTRSSLISKITGLQSSFNSPVNSVLFINMMDYEQNPELLSNITALLAPSMPSSLVRSFGEKYMIGILSYDTNEPFLILSIDDYASAYAGMLKWEKDMAQDVGPLFVENTASTTLLFTDEAIRNKDLRILRDINGKTTLLYSFIDKKTLVITKNENIFNSVLAKYLTSQNTR